MFSLLKVRESVCRVFPLPHVRHTANHQRWCPPPTLLTPKGRGASDLSPAGELDSESVGFVANNNGGNHFVAFNSCPYRRAVCLISKSRQLGARKREHSGSESAKRPKTLRQLVTAEWELNAGMQNGSEKTDRRTMPSYALESSWWTCSVHF